MSEKSEKEAKAKGLTRREFISATGAAVAGLAVGAAIGSQAFPKVVELPGVVKTETVTKTTTAAATTVTTTVTAGPPAVAPAYTELITLNVNGKDYAIQVSNNWSLMEALRSKLGLTGAKPGCDGGDCGNCSVIMDGKAVLSCLVLAVEAQGKKILTIEGLAKGGTLHPIQQAFIDNDGLQCGYCTPAMILATKALLDENPNPSEEDIKEALGNILCRCAAYPQIVKAVKDAAGRLR